MDSEKPFRTIEVLDSQTRTVCKVACMSCIRGHRTTSCGIPVCRTKVFWTVKRPGRPSNSCTCRYGSTGGCKCVVAKSACPHKAKKGEKRSGECRCDEQGRYCCLLEPEHWDALNRLQRPTVNFFPTREQLESNQASATQMVAQPQPYQIGSPPSTNSVPSTPVHDMSYGYGSYQSMQSTTLTPRFGMMGVGGPQGPNSRPVDPLAWQGEAPPAPRDLFLPPRFESVQQERDSCCQSSTPAGQNIHPPEDPRNGSLSHINLQDMSLSQPYSMNGLPAALPPQSVPFVDQSPGYDHFLAQYLDNQRPNAVCGNCSLSGCRCAACPPTLQNPGTGSWAQGCGRKHAMDVQPTPPMKMPRMENYSNEGLRARPSTETPSYATAQTSTEPPSYAPTRAMSGTPSYAPASYIPEDPAGVYHHQAMFGNGVYGGPYQALDQGLDPRPPDGTPDFSGLFEHDELLMPDTGQPYIDISQVLLSDIHRSNQDRGDRGGENGDGSGGGIGGGGGGCCER